MRLRSCAPFLARDGSSRRLHDILHGERQTSREHGPSHRLQSDAAEVCCDQALGRRVLTLASADRNNHTTLISWPLSDSSSRKQMAACFSRLRPELHNPAVKIRIPTAPLVLTVAKLSYRRVTRLAAFSPSNLTVRSQRPANHSGWFANTISKS
jgi:hypothetical protein